MKIDRSGRILIPHHARRDLEPEINTGRGKMELHTDGRKLFLRVSDGRRECSVEMNCDQAEQLGGTLLQTGRTLRTRLIAELGLVVGRT